MNVLPFSSQSGNCHGKIITDNNNNITIKGVCGIWNASKVKYAAASPADLRMSYTGSGLPYPNEDVAYEGSPNMGEVAIKYGKFEFSIVSPNSYYKHNGSVKVEPHVLFTINDQYFDVPLPSAHKFKNRSLTSLPGRYNRATGR